MTKKLDPDVLALKGAIKALNGSTSRKMLRANLAYLIDLYITHPGAGLPEHLCETEKSAEPEHNIHPEWKQFHNIS